MHVQPSSVNQISHDPVSYQHPSEKGPKKSHLIIIAIGLLTVISGMALWYFKPFNLLNQETATQFEPISVDTTIVMTVGAENIFGEDIKYEQSFYPESMQAELEESIKQRLIDESITLQAGAEANIISLDGTVFNNVYKDREKRRTLIKQVEDSINKQAAFQKGAVVSIWFMNYEPGAVGYEQGKQIAFQKITALHQAVKNGELTIKQAGDAISADTELAQVDTAYVTNAYLEFDTSKSKEISFDTTFNDELLSLDEGKITPVRLLQDYERSDFSQPKKDAVYVFGQVLTSGTQGNAGFSSWLTEQKELYAVVEM